MASIKYKHFFQKLIIKNLFFYDTNFYRNDFCVSMEYSQDLRIEFLQDVWVEFSNQDDDLTRTCIYSDFLELLRISFIYVPDNNVDTKITK